jgi:hypothetical protein
MILQTQVGSDLSEPCILTAKLNYILVLGDTSTLPKCIITSTRSVGVEASEVGFASSVWYILFLILKDTFRLY